MKNEEVYHFRKLRTGIRESLFSPKVVLKVSDRFFVRRLSNRREELLWRTRTQMKLV